MGCLVFLTLGCSPKNNAFEFGGAPEPVSQCKYHGRKKWDFTFPILVTESSREVTGHKDISILPVLRTLRQEDCLEVEASLDYMQKLCPDKPERERERREKREGEGEI